MTPIRTCMLRKECLPDIVGGILFQQPLKIGRGLRESLLRQDQIHAPIAGVRRQDRIGRILIAPCFIVQHGDYVEKSPEILRVLGGNALGDFKGLVEERGRLWNTLPIARRRLPACAAAWRAGAPRKGCLVLSWAARRHSARQPETP